MKAGNAAGAKGLGQAVAFGVQLFIRRRLLGATKPFIISKQLVVEAFKAVKANAGAAGVDKEIARMYNPVLRGWLSYYGRFSPSAMYPVLRHFNKTLVAWAMRKFRRLKGHKTRACIFIGYFEKAAAIVRTLATRDGWRVCLMGAV